MRKFFANEILSGYGKFKRKDTLRFVTRVGFVIFILIGLTSCMSMPVDQQHFQSFAPDIKIPFMGAVPQPNMVIDIEAQDPANDAWEKIGQTTSRTYPFSRFGTDWYIFSVWPGLQIPEKYWEQARNSIEYMANLRAKIGSLPLMSMKDAPAVCFAQNNDTLTDFLNNCKTDSSPTTRVYARRDFHQECVDMINSLRALEGVPALGRYKEAEECSDEDARINYEKDSPHYRQGCVLKDNNPKAGQNQTRYPTGSLDSVLLRIKDGMFTQEKQCFETETCDTCPGSSTCGHYLNIIGAEYDYDRVSCGVYVTPDGRFANVQNFWLRGAVVPE